MEEISLANVARQEREKDFIKTLAWVVYQGAALTGVAVNDPKKFPQIEDAFSSLFERKEQQDWWIMKERVESYAKEKKAIN